MRNKRVILLLACFIIALTSTANALPLANRHQLELKLGFWNQSTDTRTSVSVGGVSTSVGASGGLGGISYGYWFAENAALNVGISGMVGDVESTVGAGGVETSNSVVAPIFIGVKFYPFQTRPEAKARPYVKAAVGPVVGVQTSTSVGTTIYAEERTETVMGGQVAGGVDFILGQRAIIGLALGYNLMSDFNEPIGGSTNYSGLEFSFGIGLLFGGGR